MIVETTIIKAQYVSVWDGGVEVRTSCEYDASAKKILSVESAEVDGLDVCEREYLELPDGTEIECEDGEIQE